MYFYSVVKDEILIDFLLPVATCPEGWVRSGTFCYLLVREFIQWQDASIECMKKGGNLTSIYDKKENNFIQG